MYEDYGEEREDGEDDDSNDDDELTAVPFKTFYFFIPKYSKQIEN